MGTFVFAWSETLPSPARESSRVQSTAKRVGSHAPGRDDAISGDFHPASREIKQERRPT